MQFQALKNCLQEEEGQAMVEFAIVLPLLLFLTVGTILLTVAFMQKSNMNGLAYSSARVEAVRRDFDGPDFVLRDYQSRSGQGWVSEIKVEPQSAPAGQTRIRFTKSVSRLDVFANLISSDLPPDQPTRLAVEARMPTEYPDSGNSRRQTRNEVNYEIAGVDSLLDDKLNILIRGLVDHRQMADKAETPEEKDNIIGLGPPNRNIQKAYDEFAWGKAYSSNQEAVDGSKFGELRQQYEVFDKILSAGSQTVLDGILNSILPGASLIKNVLGSVGEKAVAGAQGSFVEAGESLNQANTEFYGQTGAQ